MLLRQGQDGGVFWRQQRDMTLVIHALSTGLKDFERALVHIQWDSEDLEESPVSDRVLETHTEMYQAARHPMGHALRLLGARFNDLGHKRRNHLASSLADRTLSHFGRLVLPLTLCWIRTLNLLWRRAQLEGSVRRQSQHQQSKQPQRQKSVHDHDFLASWREERVGGMPSRETPLSARQGEDTSWSSQPDHQYPFQYGHFLRNWEKRRDRLFTH